MNVSDYQRNSTSRMFESDFFEFFSKVHPATPFVVYLPILAFLQAWGIARDVTTWTQTALFLPVGMVTWSVLEYVIHRYFFHWEGNGPFTRRLHDIVHGYHHRFPDDLQRLVMPLGASLPMALLIAALLSTAGRPDITLPVFLGIVLRYLIYDFLHWYTHAGAPTSSWGKALRSHHMAHHFACPDKNFGISHRWLDRVIGSLRVRPEAK
jgi:dihydroceramide fatty acyl 2-hydroxylase